MDGPWELVVGTKHPHCILNLGENNQKKALNIVLEVFLSSKDSAIQQDMELLPSFDVRLGYFH